MLASKRKEEKYRLTDKKEKGPRKALYPIRVGKGVQKRAFSWLGRTNRNKKGGDQRTEPESGEIKKRSKKKKTRQKNEKGGDELLKIRGREKKKTLMRRKEERKTQCGKGGGEKKNVNAASGGEKKEEKKCGPGKKRKTPVKQRNGKGREGSG